MIKIYNGKEDADVFLKLEEHSDGVHLRAVSPEGEDISSLLIIRENGTCYRYKNVEVDGIQTDSEGRIVLDES